MAKPTGDQPLDFRSRLMFAVLVVGVVLLVAGEHLAETGRIW